jgi:hypothetical protein
MIEAHLKQLENILHAAEVIKNSLRSLDVILPTDADSKWSLYSQRLQKIKLWDLNTTYNKIVWS